FFLRSLLLFSCFLFIFSGSRISSLCHRVLEPSFTTTTTIDEVQRISAVTSAMEFNATTPSHQPWSLIQIPIAAMFSTGNNESS
ncbi:unnamed protein product, partial [Arabidopsis halleri]